MKSDKCRKRARRAGTKSSSGSNICDEQTTWKEINGETPANVFPSLSLEIPRREEERSACVIRETDDWSLMKMEEDKYKFTTANECDFK